MSIVRASALGVSDTFAEVLKNNKRAFIPFICAGDPNLDATKKALKILDDAGADIIELGVPYSDPLADGPVIQASATRALNAGATMNKVIDLVREVSPTIKAPIVMFTY
jgi:tryptophan synthase alpha chain